MGMVVRTNTMAQNANRQLAMNNSAVGKSLEKLSSGFRINRAADDASGLAISEKMKAQIKGLEQAAANSQDGISLIQTAEGATTEIHNMLNRMVELATKSANGTIQNEVDRQAIQQEVDDLNKEITRIAESTNFNGINLLDGNLGKAATVLDPKAKQLLEASSSISGTNFSAGMTNATAQKTVFNTAAGGNLALTDANYDAFKITYKNANGDTKSFTLVENAKAGITAGTGSSALLAAALKSPSGSALAVAPSDPSNEANWAEFRSLFEIDGGQAITAGGGAADGIAFTVKDPSSKASFTQIEIGSASAGVTEAIAALGTPVVAEAAVSKTAVSGGYAIDLDRTAANNVNVTNGATVQIGGKTYQFGAATAGSGNTVVGLGGNLAASTSNLLDQLKRDGFEAIIDSNDSSKIILTNPDQITQQQRGTQISSGSSNVQLTKQDASKGSTGFTITAGANGTSQKLTVNYIDEAGEAKTREITYTASNVQNTNATAIADAIARDDVLGKMFNTSVAAGAGNTTITAKQSGSGGARLVSLQTDDATGGVISAPVETVAKDTGKTLGLSDNLKAGDTITVNGKTYELVSDSSSKASGSNTAVVLGGNANDTLDRLSAALTKDGVKHTVGTDQRGNRALVFADKDGTASGGGLKLQVGDTNAEYNHVTVAVDNLSAKGIGTEGLNVSDQDAAGNSIDVIKAAINQVSTNRANLGSLQNRLEYTINNLDTTAENMTAANSRIRDTDMAKEMMQYTKMNILTQSAQAMLAQANQAPQAILQLLQ